MKVTVLGPNWIDDCSFHVHAAGCRDIGQSKYAMARRERPWSVDVETDEELYSTLFGDFFSESGTTWRDYLHDARVFPCVTLKAVG